MFVACTLGVSVHNSIMNLTSLFLNFDRAKTEHDNKMDALNKYMKYRKLPSDLTNRYLRFTSINGFNSEESMSKNYFELPSDTEATSCQPDNVRICEICQFCARFTMPSLVLWHHTSRMPFIRLEMK